MRAAELLNAGQITRLDAIAEIRDSVGADGVRVIDVRLAGGLSFEVLPGRGLDIGAVWWAGSPVSWRSPLPTAEGHTSDPSGSFRSRFKGGMLVTCGLENIGAPLGGRPLHGSYHRTAAADVRYQRELVGDDIVVTVQGLIGSMELFGRRIVVERRIISSTGTPRLQVIDRIHNEGNQPSPVALLYHVNFGAPFLDEGTRIVADSDSLIPQFASLEPADASTFPGPSMVLDESVFEYSRPRGRVVVYPTHGGDATVEWNIDQLPRLYQWVWPASGGWALGIEPSNTPLFGHERDLPDAGAPVLAADAKIETGFTLTFSGQSEAGAGDRA